MNLNWPARTDFRLVDVLIYCTYPYWQLVTIHIQAFCLIQMIGLVWLDPVSVICALYFKKRVSLRFLQRGLYPLLAADCDLVLKVSLVWVAWFVWHNTTWPYLLQIYDLTIHWYRWLPWDSFLTGIFIVQSIRYGYYFRVVFLWLVMSQQFFHLCNLLNNSLYP